jgi:hypothetical protein
MTNTTKTILIASASSALSSAAVGFICFVQGKRSGIKAEQNKQAQQQLNAGGQAEAPVHAHAAQA